MDPMIVPPWGAAWLWSLPLIVGTVVIHTFALGLGYRQTALLLGSSAKNPLSSSSSALIVGCASLYATVLLGFEGAIWAAAYYLLGALPDTKSAMLYSLGAMTTSGIGGVTLESRWRLMGPLEALDGWILFGLTTTFLLTVTQRIWRHFDQSIR